MSRVAGFVGDSATAMGKESSGRASPKFPLLGGLGTGRTLMDTVIAEVADRGDADFVVLQATDQAVPFYERLGFSKVGAVASFEEKGKSLPREAMCGLNASCEQLDNDGFTPGRESSRAVVYRVTEGGGRPTAETRDGAWCFVCKEDDTVTSVCDLLKLPDVMRFRFKSWRSRANRSNKASLSGLTQKVGSWRRRSWPCRRPMPSNSQLVLCCRRADARRV